MNKLSMKDVSKSSEPTTDDKVRELKFKYWMQTKSLKEKAFEVPLHQFMIQDFCTRVKTA